MRLHKWNLNTAVISGRRITVTPNSVQPQIKIDNNYNNTSTHPKGIKHINNGKMLLRYFVRKELSPYFRVAYFSKCERVDFSAKLDLEVSK